MKKSLVLITTIFAASLLALGQGGGKGNSSNSKIELLEFHSKTFNNTRTLRVLLPAGYQDKRNLKRRYPIFYFNDGYAVFKYWNAKKIVDQLIREGSIKPIIMLVLIMQVKKQELMNTCHILMNLSNRHCLIRTANYIRSF